MEFVDLFGLCLERGGSELCYFLLADEALGELGDDLELGGIYEVLLAVDDLDSLKVPEIPDAHVELIVKGEDIRKRLQELCSNEVASMLVVLAREALHQGDIEGVYVDGGAETVRKDVAAELPGVVDAEKALLVFGVDG
jgi:hypothetical protein